MKVPYIFVFVCLTLAIYSSCDRPQTLDQDKPEKRFRTTAPSHLFFKNLRQTQYQYRKQEGSKSDLYYPRQLAQREEGPLLLPYIVDDWLNDRAYIFFDLLDHPNGYSEPLELSWQTDGSEEIFVLTRKSPIDFYSLADQLYKLLPSNQKIYFTNANGEQEVILDDEEERRAIMMTIRDYFKLTERIK